MVTDERALNRETVPSNIPNTPTGESGDERLRLAQRIASSGSMGRSKLLRRFLLYICSRHVRGQTWELTEHQIGVHVFGRSEGYNSDDDNIVRNYARKLRKRVEEYFASEGRHEELGLEIPRGGYIPVFYFRAAERAIAHSASPQPKVRPVEPLPVSATPHIEEAAPIGGVSQQSRDCKGADAEGMEGDSGADAALVREPAAVAQAPVSQDPFSARRQVLLGAIALCAFVAIAAIAIRNFPKTEPGVAARGHSRESAGLWDQLFQKDRDTYIVAADSGLVIMEGLSGRQVSLDDYASGKYHAASSVNSKLSSAEVEDLGTRRYTSIVDLELVFRLSRLKEVDPERVVLRYSRELHIENLRSGNAILLGSADANPWASLFERQIDFRFSFDPKKRATPIIVNQHPLAGEQASYASDYDGPWHKTYGTISWLPNLDGTGHVLLIAGIDMGGTQAAGSFVLNSSSMKPILDRATSSDGSIRSFEILVESNSIAANVSPPRAVAQRIGR
jgi:hypothetical protein